MSAFHRIRTMDIATATKTARGAGEGFNNSNGFWPGSRKHLRSTSDSSGSFASETESDMFSEGSSNKSSLEYGPRTPAPVESPTIDQFHFGMDYEAPTFPTNDTATFMAGNWSGKSPAEHSFTTDVIATITSFLDREQTRYALDRDDEIKELVNDENADVYEQIDESDWDISDDEFASISVEKASAVTFFKPSMRPALISIAPSPLREKQNATGTVSMTRGSSRTSTLYSRYSWNRKSSSDASDASESSYEDVFHEVSQWNDSEQLRKKPTPHIKHEHCFHQPQQTRAQHEPSNDVFLPRTGLVTHSQHPDRRCDPIAANDQPLPLNRYRTDSPSLSSRVSRLAKKSSTNLRLCVNPRNESLRSGSGGDVQHTSTAPIFHPPMPAAVVPTRSSSKKHLQDSSKISKTASSAPRRLRRNSAKYTIFPQLVH